MKRYFYTDGKDKFGPFEKEELKNESINRNTLVWYYGLGNWTKISDLEELDDIVNSIPPEIKIQEKEIYKKEKNFTIAENKEIKDKTPKKQIRWGWIIFLLIIPFGYFMNKVRYKPTKVNNSRLEILMNIDETPEDFQMYVDKFYRDINFYSIYPKKPQKTIIKFSKLDQIDNLTHYHAISFGANNDDIIEIYINRSTWEEFNKPKRYFLMYHELAHDVLNLDDLKNIPENKGKLMFPEISSYEGLTMDDFIETFQELFEEVVTKQTPKKVIDQREISKSINYMEDVAELTNKALNLPTKIEEFTIAEKITFDSDKMILTYTYTIDTDSADISDVKKRGKEIEIEKIKQAQNLHGEDKNYKLLKVIIKSVYQDSNGKELYSFNITPEQYSTSSLP